MTRYDRILSTEVHLAQRMIPINEHWGPVNSRDRRYYLVDFSDRLQEQLAT